jgi:antitoxin HigA-1
MPPIKNAMPPIHPGEIMLEEYLRPLGMSANALANAIGVPANRISAIIAGDRGITADTALRLARAFSTTPDFWLNLQKTYELRVAEEDAETSRAVRAIRRLVPA